MNMKQKTNKGRFFGATVLILLLLTLLSGCFGGNTVTLTMASTITKADGGNMEADQLKSVGDLMVAVYNPTEFDVHDMIIAASRGYDMTAAGFDDSTVDPNALGTDDPVEAAKNVLRKANERAADASKISEATFENMNEADLQRLVDIFKITVDITTMGGAIDSIQRWIGGCLNWITRYLGFGSYIVGICIFAVIIELLMMPFAVKQQKNSIRQAKLRPKEMAIRNKYKGRTDQPTLQKMQKEIQELYQRENFSPFGGCLPLLIQLPIVIVLYNIVVDPLHYVLGQTTGVSSALVSYCTAARAAGGLGEVLQSSNGTIELLSGGIDRFAGIADFQFFNNGSAVWDSLDQITSVPNFNIFGQNFGLTPSFSRFDWLLLVPVLTFVVYFFSMRLNRKFTVQPMQDGVSDRQVACSNTMMDISMPAMSTFFTFMVPGIVGVYWMFRSIVGLGKTFLMSKIMPLPKFTEEDYKAAAREMAGKAPKVVKSERAGKVRSLHHIDDEDFEDTREQALVRKAAIEEMEQQEKAEKAKKTPFGVAAMKKDRKPVEKAKEEPDAGRPAEDTAEPTAEGTSEETMQSNIDRDDRNNQ